MSKFLNILAPAIGGAGAVMAMAYTLADQFIVDMPAPLREAVAVAPANAEEPKDATARVMAAKFSLGREATTDEIAAWDIDVRPDGQGLPPGSGDVMTGEELYVDNCAMCHGDFGEAVGRWPVLAGGQGTLTNDRPVKTIGSYWPYLSTVFDYVHRAMPFGNAQSLSDDDVYAITAYLLYLNDLVDDDFELSNENFTEVRMPNEDNFYPDDRAEIELTAFTGDVCMENCKDAVDITGRAAVVDVTPDDAAARKRREEAAAAAEGTAAPTEVAAAETAPAAPAAPAVDDASGDDSALAEAGEKVFRKCKACHAVGEGASNKVGPHLNGLDGRTVGGVDGFKYSGVFTEAQASGMVWNQETLTAFLANPKTYMKGTKMSFAGLKKQDDIDAVIAYINAEGEE